MRCNSTQMQTWKLFHLKPLNIKFPIRIERIRDSMAVIETRKFFIRTAVFLQISTAENDAL